MHLYGSKIGKLDIQCIYVSSANNFFLLVKELFESDFTTVFYFESTQ